MIYVTKSVDDGWIHYYDEKRIKSFKISKCGKWSYFFNANSDFSIIENNAIEAVETGIVSSCKYTNPDRFDYDKCIKRFCNDTYNLINLLFADKSEAERKILYDEKVDFDKPLWDNLIDSQMKKGGIMCFYLNIDDFACHRRVLEFMIKKNLINRKKDGSLSNISFKLDSETRAGYYGKLFKGKINLNKLIDPFTGQWKYNENN